MMRSLISAVGALRNHQVYMDVIAANIANVNTTGFKASRVTFQELMSQTLRYPSGGSSEGTTYSSLNPMQVGLGMTLGGIDTIFTQGSLQASDRPTDLAIEGAGFFAVSDGSTTYYTRDGILGSWNNLLINSATGMAVMGWAAAADGTIDSTQPISAITVPSSRTIEATATALATLQGNLDAGAAVGDTLESTVPIYDSLGNLHNITLTFTKTDVNEWTWQATTSETGVTISPTTASTITFESDGTYTTTNPDATLTITYTNGAESPATVDLGLSNLTQVGYTGNVSLATQNGRPAGQLVSFVVSQIGVITGIFSNGVQQDLGQVSLVRFANPPGLMKVGQGLFAESGKSGTPEVGTAGSRGYGTIASGYLEMANVDLAKEFVNMIAAQRGFQANARVINASDEMLQELINLRR